jgi:hypothetical protein
MGLGHIHRAPCSTGNALQRELGMRKTLVFLIVLIALLLLLAKGLRGVKNPRCRRRTCTIAISVGNSICEGYCQDHKIEKSCQVL